MTKIYDQHRAAFANVSAYVVVGTNAKGEPDRKANHCIQIPARRRRPAGFQVFQAV